MDYASIDRPLALWLNARFYGTAVFGAAAFILRPLDILVVAGSVLLVIAVVWRQYGAPARMHRFMAAGLGAAAALLGALVLKVAIGRSQVYPPFLRDHIYGCRLGAGSTEFMAFPSATMAALAGCFMGLGLDRRRERLTAGVVLIVMAGALLITNGHWLSDITGGTYLGARSGVAVGRRLGRGDRSPGSPVATGAIMRRLG